MQTRKEKSQQQWTFIAWLRLGPRSEACLCASAILHYARDQQYGDLRSAVGPDTAWELCCRTLSLPDNAISIGSRTLANLLIYWLDGGHLPVGMGDAIYAGMREDLHAREKAIQTEQDEHAVKTRWVKQLIHREFDIVREAWLKEQPEAPVDLEVLGGH